jgi:PAS domain S-box-containing protein
MNPTECELPKGRELAGQPPNDYAEAILAAVPPLLVLDSELRVQMANESFYKHFRVAPSRTEHCLVYELGNGQWNIPKLRTFLEEVLPRHSFFKDFEVTHQFEDLGLRTVMLSGRQVDDLQRILLIIDDITERLESRTVLRASEIRYRRLFEAARDGILILDPVTRKITDANPFMSELLGYPRAELLGKELWEIGLLKDEAASRAAFRELQANHFIRYEDLPLQTKAGDRHEVEFVSNLYDEDRRKVIQCNIRDITQRKRTENDLRHAKEMLANHAAQQELLVAERTAKLRETVGELQAFSYSVAHDMRSPLRAMQGFAQFLLDDYRAKLDEKGINYLQQIMRAALRLDRLIQDVLSYSSVLHANHLMEPVDLDRLMRDLIQTYPIGHKTEIHIHGKLPKVWGNEAYLTQCFANLLSNAAKFVAPGTSPHIEIRAEDCSGGNTETHPESAQRVALSSPANTTVRICVEDNGIGIAPENHNRIFSMFGRINPAKQYEGTGIGLSIVRKAAERLGAQLGFESELGQGSRFWIQLQKA